MQRQPNLGGPAEDTWEVVRVLSGKLVEQIDFRGERYLDIGCGNGAFTIGLGREFSQVYGIDVEEARLAEFHQKVEARDLRNYTVQSTSAEAMDFPDNYFDVITAIEVIEHIPDLPAALDEIHRVLKPGGIFGITCPNRLFPFETHGIWWRGEEKGGRYPLLPYIPPLHNRFALARVFTANDLQRLLLPRGFSRLGLDYAYPTFERGNRLGRLARPLKRLMRTLEHSPLRSFGVSIVTAYQKPVS
jgi:SAM-dependent methyltransferase